MKPVFAIFYVVLAMYSFSAYAKTFEEVAAEVQAAKAEAERELQRIRRENAQARIPVSRKLSALEDEVLALRKREESAEVLRSRNGEVDRLKASLEADTREYESLAANLNAWSALRSPSPTGCERRVAEGTAGARILRSVGHARLGERTRPACWLGRLAQAMAWIIHAFRSER